MKVLIADQLEEAAREALGRLGCEVRFDASLDGDALGEALAEFRPDMLMVRSTKVPADVIGRADGLKAIVRAGAGFDNIDVGAAGAAGVCVCNCPGMNAVAVAELAMAHLLCCDRRIPDQTRELRAGHWNKKEYSRARGLKGMRLGIVGVGAIGREVMKRAIAFDMRVFLWSLGMTPERAEALGVESGGSTREDLLTMLRSCDAVTVHVSATDETRGMCDAEFFDALPDGAYFINTSRGVIVDEQALANAIRTKGIRAGLDVYLDQPSEKDCAWKPTLADIDGVASLTHHIGASTDQAQAAVGEEAVRIVEVYMESGRFVNCVNRDELAAGTTVVTRAGQSAPAGG